MVAVNDSAAGLSELVPTAPRDLTTPRSVQTWANSSETYRDARVTSWNP